MHQKAPEGQCAAEEIRHEAATAPIRHPRLTLPALALGTFAIVAGRDLAVLLLCLFGVGATMMLYLTTVGRPGRRAMPAYAAGAAR